VKNIKRLTTKLTQLEVNSNRMPEFR